MKKQFLIFSICTMAISVFNSCSKIDNPDDPANFPNLGKLQVKAALYSSGANSSFGTDEQIGLFICNNLSDRFYDNPDYINILCTSQGADQYWKFTEDIDLGAEDMTVFAYYPFKPSIKQLKSIPVDITRMEDLCFGVNNQQTPLNRTQPLALITMQHALAKIKFNLILDEEDEYNGSGIIESARVVKLKPDGSVDEDRYNVLTLEGAMDATTGRIKTTVSGKLPIEMLINKVFTHEGIDEDKQPYFYSVPEIDMTDYAFAIMVDGKEHIIRIDNGTEWRSATINTYALRLKGETLTLDQNENNGFDIQPWKEIEKEIHY